MQPHGCHITTVWLSHDRRMGRRMSKPITPTYPSHGNRMVFGSRSALKNPQKRVFSLHFPMKFKIGAPL
jgi:hypothetical protein